MEGKLEEALTRHASLVQHAEALRQKFGQEEHLQSELEELRGHRAQAEERTSHLMGRVGEMEAGIAKLDTMQATLRQKELEIERLRQQQKGSKAGIDRIMKSARQKMKQAAEGENALADVARLQNELAKLQGELVQKDAEVQKLAKVGHDHAHQEKTGADAQAELAQKEAAMQSAATKANVLCMRYRSLQDAARGLEKSKQQEQQLRGEMAQRCEELQAELKQAQKASSDAVMETCRLSDVEQRQSQELAEQESASAAMSKEKQRVEDELEESGAQVRQLTEQQQQSKQEHSEQLQQLQRQQAELEGGATSDAQTEVRRLEDELAQKEAAMQSAATKANVLCMRYRSLQDAARGLEKSKQQEQQLRGEMAQRCEELQAELKQAQKASSEGRAHDEEKQLLLVELGEKKLKQSAMELTMERLLDRISELEQGLDDREGGIDALQQELEAKSGVIEAMQQEQRQQHQQRAEQVAHLQVRSEAASEEEVRRVRAESQAEIQKLQALLESAQVQAKAQAADQAAMLITAAAEQQDLKSELEQMQSTHRKQQVSAQALQTEQANAVELLRSQRQEMDTLGEAKEVMQERVDELEDELDAFEERLEQQADDSNARIASLDATSKDRLEKQAGEHSSLIASMGATSKEAQVVLLAEHQKAASAELKKVAKQAASAAKEQSERLEFSEAALAALELKFSKYKTRAAMAMKKGGDGTNGGNEAQMVMLKAELESEQQARKLVEAEVSACKKHAEQEAEVRRESSDKQVTTLQAELEIERSARERAEAEVSACKKQAEQDTEAGGTTSDLQLAMLQAELQSERKGREKGEAAAAAWKKKAKQNAEAGGKSLDKQLTMQQAELEETMAEAAAWKKQANEVMDESRQQAANAADVLAKAVAAASAASSERPAAATSPVAETVDNTETADKQYYSEAEAEVLLKVTRLYGFIRRLMQI
jgi:chromosome segregation ATPase